MASSIRPVDELSPEEVCDEIISILADGVLQYQQDRKRRIIQAASSSDFDRESAATCLESSPATRLTVPTG
jgi:hypothetical protein